MAASSTVLSQSIELVEILEKTTLKGLARGTVWAIKSHQALVFLDALINVCPELLGLFVRLCACVFGCARVCMREGVVVRESL